MLASDCSSHQTGATPAADGAAPPSDRHRRQCRDRARSNRLDLDGYRYLHSTRGELLRRLGRSAEARDAYRRALTLAHDDAERRLLERRLAELGSC